MSGWPASFGLAGRLAVREMRAGLSGFMVFLACLALGVGAIAAVGTLSHGLTAALAREGRTILGGDLSWSLIHREASPEEIAHLRSQGTLTRGALLRAMVRRMDQADQALTEVKAVDGAYPLAGRLEIAPSASLPALLAERDGIYGAVAEAALLDRLRLAVGDRIRVGEATLQIRALVRSEPDKLAGGIGFGPRLLISLDALQATGLVQPGSLIRWTYRVAAPGLAEQALDRAIAEANERFPEAGWEAKTRRNASQQLTANIERFSQFLALVGLTALLIGGVGIANAVKAHVDSRIASIATLKALGASGGFVVLVYLLQTALIAALGILIGLGIGVLLPSVAVGLSADLLPVPIDVGVFPGELGLAAAYGALIAFAFALWPLGRAHDVPVQALYREAVEGHRSSRRRIYVLAVVFTAIGLVALATSFAPDWRLAVLYAGAATATLVLLSLVARAIMALARALPRPRATIWRLAIANIHRPGALTPTVVLSLGLGLTLFVALALIEGNLRRQLTSALPDRAPSFFFIDVPSAGVDAFTAFLRAEAPQARIDTVPILRGRIVSLKGVPAADAHPDPDAAWVLAGDRGLTYTERLPANAMITNGAWWPENYAGPPLVSFEAKLARGLHLDVGDRVVVNVLGRNIEATVANTRTVQWDSLGINFVMLFSPSTFRGAPFTYLATVTFPGGAGGEQELALLNSVTKAYPDVAAIRVKEALDAVNALVGELSAGVRAASLLTLLSGIIVLGGALAAGQRARIYDVVILKTLGATRRRLLLAFTLEYLLLGLATGVFALGAGSLAAWGVVSRLMSIPFVALPDVAVGAVALALALTVGFGLVGTWRALRQRPAPVLRAL